MEPGTENNPGNQRLSRLVTDQWNRTTPELKALFDSLFLAVTHPENWDSGAACWDPQVWIRALEADQAVNDKEIYHMDYSFENDVYHLV